uniref:C-type lectin domain-containing protein n=1 Tax=Astyanax mexicanus TaxID=7994 RepID=A0A3B1IXY7_ASTMX
NAPVIYLSFSLLKKRKINVPKSSSGSVSMFFIGTLAGCEAASEGRQVRSGNAAAVGLGLLCFILLAVIVGLSIKHNAEIQQIQNSYTNITLERDQLQTSYTNITLERDQLQTSYDNLTLEKRWTSKQFMSSCYYISINMQTWDQSRMDSKRNRNFWIGLTDQYHQGQWKWVDGSSLTSQYWMKGEPNDFKYWKTGYTYIYEDCAQITFSYDPLSNWKDVRCDTQLTWICEMRTQY